MAPEPPGPRKPYPNDFQDPSGGGLSAANGTIFEFYPAVMREKPETIADAAAGWKKLAVHLDLSANDVKTAGDTLKPDWTSSASLPFLRHVDNTEISLLEWHGSASRNEGTLNALASAITDAKAKMQRLWNEFKQALEVAQAQEDNKSGVVELLDGGVTAGILPDALTQAYTHKTVTDVLEPMANAYSTAFSVLSSGTQFRGPSDAAKPSDDALRNVLGGEVGNPGGGGGSPGGSPHNPVSGKSDRPQLPMIGRNALNVTPPQTPTISHNRPVTPPALTKQVIRQPPVPPGERPVQSQVVPSLPGGEVIVPPVAPVGPNADATGAGRVGHIIQGEPPTAPRPSLTAGAASTGALRAAGPASPNLYGRNSHSASNMPPRSAAPASPPPQIAGRGGGGPASAGSAPPGLSRAKGLSGPGEPDAPAIPGRTADSATTRAPRSPGRQSAAGGGVQPPPDRSGAPQSLRGVRSGAPQRPTLSGSSLGPVGPHAQQSRPLDGRLASSAAGSPETLNTARGALRPGLDGRGLPTPGMPAQPDPGTPGVRPAASAPVGASTHSEQTGRSQPAYPRQRSVHSAGYSQPRRERLKADQQAHRTSQTAERIGDAELFTVDNPAPPTIERPEERRQARWAGPAIGRVDK